MSQTNPEANDLAAVFGAAAGSAARVALSNEFAGGAIGAAAADIIKNLKNGETSPTPSDGKKPSNSGSPPSDSAPVPAETPGQKHKPGSGGILSDLLGDHKPSKPKDTASDKTGMINDLHNMMEKGGRSLESFFKNITDADRKVAKDALAKSIDPAIRAEDKQILKDMQAAIIDGNAENLAKALKPLAGKPDRIADFVKSINSQLDKGGTGVELGTDSKGNVLLYEKGANTAVSINPETGATELRVVERQADGSVVLKPGEIINRTVADVMKNVGDEATRNLITPRFNRLRHFDDISPLNGRKGAGGGGGGGGGGDGSGPSSLDKLFNPPSPAKPPSKPGDSK